MPANPQRSQSVERLIADGAEVTAVDPLILARYVPASVTMADLDSDLLDRADVVLVLTDHDEFDWDAISKFAGKVLDTRNRMLGTDAELL